MDQQDHNLRRSPKKIALLIATWVGALLLVEAGVRVTHPEAGRPVFPGYPAGLMIAHDELGHVMQADFRGYFPLPRYQDIPIEINSLGFRDAEWSEQPDPARPRVLVFGDSITFGSPLRREERFTEQAMEVMAARGTPVETCNCGVAGYNVEQYNKLLQLIGPRLRPRVVLIGYCLNDAEPLSPDDARRIALGAGLKQGGAWARWRNFAWGHALDLGQSYAFNFVRRTLKQRMWSDPETSDKKIAEYNEQTRLDLIELYDKKDGVARLRENLRAMKEFTEQTLGAKMAVVIFAYRHQLVRQEPALSRKVEAVLTELNIPFVDLYDVFLPHAAEAELYVYQDDCHPAAAGHRMAGEAVGGLLALSFPAKAGIQE